MIFLNALLRRIAYCLDMIKGLYGRLLLVAADLERMHGTAFAAAFLEDYYHAKVRGDATSELQKAYSASNNLEDNKACGRQLHQHVATSAALR